MNGRIPRYAVLIALGCLSGSLSRANLTSEVKVLNGTPSLYVNGQLTSQVLWAPYRGAEADIADALQAGISHFNIYVRFDWTGPEQYDFSRLDSRIDVFLKLDPKARFIGRVILAPGNWFCQQFPNEITLRDDGSPAGIFDYSPPTPACHPSLSSEIYRDLSHKAVIALITHLEQKYGDHFVGYQAGNGFGGEWLTFNSFWETRPGMPPPKKFGVEDYSPAARTGFRNWLRKKYVRTEQLRAAWADPKVTFETATLPNEVERYTTTHGIIFDPAVSQRVTDFFSFFNDTVSDVLVENCRWIKEITNRKKIVGAFYGYLWCNFPNLSVVHTGHLGIAKVLRSPDLDFLAGPYTYDNKQIGGPNNSQGLPEAAALHGKLFFSEVDTETHVEARQWRWGDCLNNPKNLEETKGLLSRDFGYSLAKGFGMWWTDLHSKNFHDNQVLKHIADLQKIDARYLSTENRSNSEIAVVLDEESFKYFGDGEPLWNALLTAQKQWELGFIGASWDPQLLTDMDNPKLRDYKLYIFLNTFRVTAEQRAAIHARLKRNHATALWVYAPGYIGEKLSVENMRELTGIKLAESNSAGELHVDLTTTDNPYTKSLPKAMAYGTDVNVANIIRYYDHQIYLKDPRDPGLQRDLPGFRINPRFWSDDPGATVLGNLAGVNKPGLVVKKQQGWTSIYSAAPILPAALLRNIARAAGCHIYSDANDVVSANKNFLAVYAPGGGTRVIHLPAKAKVVDLIDNRTVSNGAKDFSLALAPNQTALFAIER
jgi:hypothetical protein